MKNNNGESETEVPTPSEPDNPIDKLKGPVTARQIADAYGLLATPVRIKLNRAAKEDFDLRTEIANPKAREAKYLYDAKRAKPYMKKLKANLKKQKASRNP